MSVTAFGKNYHGSGSFSAAMDISGGYSGGFK
jgi:hypothetical protein